MILALTGSHGTGKTTIFEAIKAGCPDYLYFSEGVRHQVPAFGYSDPHKIVDEIGIGAFELMNINSWSVIDYKVNTALDLKTTIITDRSSIDNYGYYLTLKNKSVDSKVEKLVKNMARYYASLIDIFVYFPIGVFPLKADNMRSGDEDYQNRLDENIMKTFSEFEVPQSKIYRLKPTTVEERVNEILKLI